MPSLSDQCVTESCTDGFCYNLTLALTQEQRLTEVTSHEFAEMCTDPAPFSSWTPEIGDPSAWCNPGSGTGTITVGPNTWTVLQIFSVTDNTNTGNFCVSQAAAPEPELPGGPAAGVGNRVAFRPAELTRLLPLPPVHLNLKERRVSVKEGDVRRYVNRILQPLRASDLYVGLPGLLRQAAEIIEKPAPVKRPS